MPGTIPVAQSAADAPLLPVPLGRRRFVAGMAALTGGLAGAVVLGPDWGAGAPARPVAPLVLDPPAQPVGAFGTSVPATPAFIAPPRPVITSAADRLEWLAFCHSYVTPEGRVIDTGNGNASHSEGQGWGLMAAQACDDPETFALLLDWTTHNLRRRPYDVLHAWRYRPGDANPVQDLNNATDGDLFIAAALARAAVRWDRPDYAAQAARLAATVLSGLVRKAGARTVLLPGVTGFEQPDAFTINLSYYAFALFPDLAALAPSPLWETLRRDGLAMVLQGRFGRWRLPPDWLRVGRTDGALSIAPGWPARFSFDAIRVPLHAAWAQLPAAPLLDAFRQYWAAPRAVPPGWVDLRTEAVAPYPAPTGMRAVAALVAGEQGGKGVPIPPVTAATDYYSAGLVLLARLAAGESRHG